MLILAKLALEEHDAIMFAMLNAMQLLAEDGMGSKQMKRALGLDPADVLKAKSRFGQGLSVLKPARPRSSRKSPRLWATTPFRAQW